MIALRTKKEEPLRNELQKFLCSIKQKKSNETLEMSVKETVDNISTGGNPFMAFISFLESLTCSYDDGRIIIHISQDKQLNKFQFLLLNPAAQFSDVVKNARSVRY